METCEVCEGSGEYPIHKRGMYVYSIQCPECNALPAEPITEDRTEYITSTSGIRLHGTVRLAGRGPLATE